jgi:cobalt-zinc-cadmium efflux system protein
MTTRTSPAAPTSAGGPAPASRAGDDHPVEHATPAPNRQRRSALGWALGLNAALLIGEAVAGLAFGSLALLADATHLVSDVAGLGIALAGAVLAARPVSTRHSFGLARAEILAAQASAVLLLAAGGWIGIESLRRLQHPAGVNGAGLAAVAAGGLVINLASAALVHRQAGHDLNMRASFLHLATDAAGSLGAVTAGLLILATGWTRADPAISALTAALVLWAGWRLLRETTHVLMEGTPRDLDPDTVRDVLLAMPGVQDVHHLHLWTLTSEEPALSAHLVLAGEPTLRQAQHATDQARATLSDRLHLTHVTLELECARPTAGGTDHPAPTNGDQP